MKKLEEQHQLEQQKAEAEDCIRVNELLKNDSLDDGKRLILDKSIISLFP